MVDTKIVIDYQKSPTIVGLFLVYTLPAFY